MNSEGRIVFCDFDGTITVEDSFVKVCRQFAPEIVNRLLYEIFKERISLKDGIREIVESIPSSEYPAMLDFVAGTPVREGLEDLLDFLDQKQIPFVVISGGLSGLVLRQLGSFASRVEKIYAADVNTDGEYIRVISPYEDGNELVNKKNIMGLYSYKDSVAIGDGVTDHGLALASSLIFARKHLASFLDKYGRAYEKWDDFYDIRKKLESRWK